MYEMKENKKSFESQQKIYKGLRRLLKTKPLSEITVSDIKAECNISRSTFYRNFKNITEILEVIFEFFYNEYLTKKKSETIDNELLFFFEYWFWHRDLVQIISSQNRGIIEDCMKRHTTSLLSNPYLLEIKITLMASILSKWAELKDKTPKELESFIRNSLDKNCIDILLE